MFQFLAAFEILIDIQKVIVFETFTRADILVSWDSVNVKTFLKNYGKLNFGCYGCHERRVDVCFKLGEYQTVRGIVPTLVWEKNARVVFILFISLSGRRFVE